MENMELKYKLKIQEDLSLSELEVIIENGGKFIVYQYCISIVFAVTLVRYSPAFLITDENKNVNYKKNYNLLSLLFGWWAFPYGPMNTLKSFSVNRKGGVDVSNDIMFNMNPDYLKNREVFIEVTNELFCKPDKDDRKEFDKAVKNDVITDVNIDQLVVGLFINTEEYEDPYYTIGINVKKDFEATKVQITKALHRRFRKFTRFEFVDLKNEDECIDLLRVQGVFLIDRVSKCQLIN